MNYRRYLWIQIFSLVLMAVCAASAVSETIDAAVKDVNGQPVADAVVYADSVSGAVASSQSRPRAAIDQIDKEFVEYVTPVIVGTAVFFPNSDNIRHHVYSFSPAKTFEIPLYPKGSGPPTPIIFDKPGVVVLGCNIHDWMKAYVYVVETPYFAVTDKQGRANISNLPEGEYNVRVWHPRMKKASEITERPVRMTSGTTATPTFTLKLKKEWRPLRAAKLGGGVYR